MPQNRQGKKKQHEASFASPGVEKIKEQVTGLTVSPYGPIRAANNMGMPSTFQLPPQYLPRVARINDSPLYNRIFGTLASFITHFQMPINVDPTRFTNGVAQPSQAALDMDKPAPPCMQYFATFITAFHEACRKVSERLRTETLI
ncbi:hypothetical protein CU097_001217 [Rhizopus azygosporus]|uniref:Uncharacterized protein n=1 Tax=Rhizopus azygosporus TaxID=86630 RepID=A0A367JDG5_RHIAZ|nr:hypothetical protein CU097_001217 [Rhizopus azygosporus]